MITDQQGNRLSGATAQAAEHYNEAQVSFALYRGDPLAMVDRAIETAPNFAMAHILKAYMLGVATEPAANEYAKEIVDKLSSMRLDDREASHTHALELMLDGGWTAAAQALDMHNVNYPLDMVAVHAGHLLDFYRGCARDLRDRVARVLPAWSPDIPGYSLLLGMYAFGLEEAADYTKAEEKGRRAIELQPLDSWAHHAVAHVMEMQGRTQEGLDWMTIRKPYWADDDNFFKVHNWWHHAVYLLDLGRGHEALALYDSRIRVNQSQIALELVDASAMLWRLHLAGVDVGERWSEVANCWEPHADGNSYPFNDWHAVMAYLGAGRDNDIECNLLELRRKGSEDSEIAQWARLTAIPLIEGFTAFWRQDYQTAAEKLHGARFIVDRFGGSHAQRDIIDLTLMEAAIRGGYSNLATGLTNERLALKPSSHANANFLKRIHHLNKGSSKAA
ncbi:tetratricopeptide repeat protein 38 family protein [Pollutimonas nitritireducens]|uniref:Tetratricopeptide repeat protein 38 n=1 Tax=Pollutimonas nitritireducens TaxID=2045209 RepID=A0A2N4UF27_9BURK|nr:tetratricopeptide repeat protein [Pollutimonas nitritireducens]PLC53605.1 tetratricopeptide repeat protein 38 family protein [Pollutimonas nitritireducens]